MDSLNNKVALVTGASRGIGRAIASQLGKDGAFVAGTATTEKGAEAITKWMQEEGINGEGFVLNVTDPDAVVDVVKTISAKFGNIAVLVNNAGITRDNLLMRMKEDEWGDVIDTNLSSIYRLSKAVLRGMMKAKTGRIINIGSVVGSNGNAGQTNYAAAKGGLVAFGKAMAREVGSRNITINTVAPGFIETDMTDELSAEQKELLLQQIPLNRLGAASEIANVVAFLASDSAAYITGETIHVNGGMYMS